MEDLSMCCKGYITPEQLICSALFHHAGRITRRELYDDIMILAPRLEEKGYGVLIAFKGSPGRWHSGDVDTPLSTYLNQGLLQEPEPGVYEFNPWNREPYTSPQEYLEFLTDDLGDEARRILEDPQYQI